MRRNDRRVHRDRPFLGEHTDSVRRAMVQPKGMGGLLTWFLEGFRAEMPERIHARGVWRDYVRVDESGGGGSLIGSPRLADPFRAFIEGSAFATEASEYEGSKSRAGDEHYRTPMRAAIARLAGRHDCSLAERDLMSHRCPENAVWARLAYRILARDGDWESAAAEFVQPALSRWAVETALVRVWRAYDIRPPQRVVEASA